MSCPMWCRKLCGFHFTAINEKGYRKLTEGDVVELDVTRGEKGLKAENVVVLETGEQSGEQIHPNETESTHSRALAPTCKLLGRLKRQDCGRFSKPPPSASRPPLRRDLRGFYCSSGRTFSQLRVYPPRLVSTTGFKDHL